MLNSDKVKVWKNVLGQKRIKTGKCYHPSVINSFSPRNMAIKICSRTTTWHKTNQSYIIVCKGWGGGGREGGITKWEGEVLVCRRKKRVSVK